MWGVEREDFRLTSPVWPRRAVVDDIPDEELVVFSIDLRDENSHRSCARRYAERSDGFCEQEHLLRQRLVDAGFRGRILRSDIALAMPSRRVRLVNREMHRLDRARRNKFIVPPPRTGPDKQVRRGPFFKRLNEDFVVVAFDLEHRASGGGLWDRVGKVNDGQ